MSSLLLDPRWSDLPLPLDDASDLPATRPALWRGAGRGSVPPSRGGRGAAARVEARSDAAGDFKALVLELAGSGQALRIEHVRRIKPLVVGELRARGLLFGPPEFVGYGDLSAWDEQSLDLIACDALEWAVLRRLDALAAKAEVFPNIDGLVVRNVRNFLTERQAAVDPVGASVYRNLRAGAARGMKAGWLVSSAARCPPARDQVLGGSVEGKTWSPERIEAQIDPTPGWWDNLRSVGEGGAGAPAAGAEILRSLLAAGVEAFTVSDVARALAPGCRGLLAARNVGEEVGFDGDEDAPGALVLVVRPIEFETYRGWLDFVEQVVDAIDALDTPPERRAAISRVFATLVALNEQERLEDSTQRALCERLALAKSTLNDYIQVLRTLVSTLRPDRRRK